MTPRHDLLALHTRDREAVDAAIASRDFVQLSELTRALLRKLKITRQVLVVLKRDRGRLVA